MHERDEAESSWTGFRMSEPEELSKSDDAACLPEEPTKARGAWHGIIHRWYGYPLLSVTLLMCVLSVW